METTPYLIAISCSSSVLSFTTLSFPENSCAIASTAGATARQGPHQGAQKSTSTGVPERSTSESKLASVTGVAFDMGALPLRFAGVRGGHGRSAHAELSFRDGSWRVRSYGVRPRRVSGRPVG